MDHPLDDFCGSQFWNATKIWYSESLQIPYCFEQTVLLWIPCAFLWTFAILEIITMKNSLSRNIPWNLYNCSKITAIFTLTVLGIVDLIRAVLEQKANADDVFNVDIVNPIIKVLTFGLALGLVFGNRKYGITSSGILFLFWFVLLILSIPQLNTEINLRNSETNSSWRNYKFTSFVIYVVLVSINFLLVCFVDKRPTENKYSKSEKDSLEQHAAFLSKITFTWFDSIIWKGYKTPLNENDLYDLKPEDQYKEIVPAFTHYYNKTKKPVSVLPVILKTFKGSLIFGSILELFNISVTYASPIFLKLIIGFVEKKYSDHKEPLWKGISYVVLLFSCAALQTLFNSQYIRTRMVIGMRIKTALINLIYKKYLTVSNASRKQSTVGEIVNLMAVDTERFVFLALCINTFWSAPLQIGVCLYFLWGVIGPSVLAGFAMMLLMIPINVWIANTTKKLQVKQMAHKDKRVKMMNEILNGIKVLKLYAWELSFQKIIDKIRDKEIKTLRGKAFVTAGSFFAWNSLPFFVSFVTFATFVMVDENNVLDAQTAFVALSLFNILRRPLTILPSVISHVIQTMVSLKRINKFLNCEELNPDNVQHDEKYAETPVIIENGSFSWADNEVCIKNINMKVQKGSLVAIVGAVGCGKTSLVSAILGEMNKLEGSVNTVGKIAYVPQQAWLMNCSLRENILFGQPFDRKRYQKVIRACALVPDIEMLSAGDATEIGEKGINLSGGQKQRISLARAVYSDSDIFLFDDPLSAVDSHVGKHIFDEVIGPYGLLSRKTKLLVTHGVVFLPQVDKIFVMKEGEITESGSYQELWDAGGEFSDFLHTHQVKEQEESSDEHEPVARSFSRTDSSTSGTGSVSSLKRLNSLKEKESKPENKGKLIKEESAEQGSVQIGVYKRYINSIGFKFITACIAFSIAFQGFQIYSNLWLADWSNDSEASTNHSKRNLYIGVYAALGLAQAISIYSSFLLIAIGCLYSARRMHNQLLKSVFRWPMELFDTTPVGRILNRFSKDINTLDNVLPELLLMFVSQIFAVLGTIVVISISTPMFLVVVVPVFILYYFVQRFYVSTTRQLSRLESKTRSPIYSHFGESISGIVSIRAFGVQERFIEMSDNFVDHNQACKYPSIIAARWLGVRLEMVSNLAVLFAALFAILGDQENAALVGLSITYALQITTSMNLLVNNMSLLEANVVSVERIHEYEDTKKEAEWIIKKTMPNNHWPDQGNVEFIDYKVRYREGLDLVLRGINVQIKGGEKIGIVGRTGAGKSSLTLGIFRIIEAAGGQILIDGIDIAKLGLHDLRCRLTIIPQDPVLFSGSLRINLDPFEEKSDQEIWRSLELAHLKSFVNTLSAGLNHEISEGGENLSVGQRQLICLARALLRKTKVLILDEATAAIDLETDDLIQKTIRNEFSGCTILTIAHRLNTILDSDRVMVLDKGVISEFEAPADLLKKEDSIFYNMAKDANIVS